MLSTNSWNYEIYQNNPYADKIPDIVMVQNDFLDAIATARFKRKHYQHPNFGIACPCKYPTGKLLRKALRIE